MCVYRTGETRCPKCGKRFVQTSPGQQYCYDPCIPRDPRWEFASADKVQRECIMYHTDGCKEWCSGLQALYCGFGECRFYKKKERKKK